MLVQSLDGFISECSSVENEVCYLFEPRNPQNSMEDAFHTKVIVHKDPDLEGQSEAYQMNIELMGEKDNRSVSETYGYIFIERG